MAIGAILKSVISDIVSTVKKDASARDGIDGKAKADSKQDSFVDMGTQLGAGAKKAMSSFGVGDGRPVKRSVLCFGDASRFCDPYYSLITNPENERNNDHRSFSLNMPSDYH